MARIFGLVGKISPDSDASKYISHNFSPKNIKGSLQRKLYWVKSGVNRNGGALDCGARHSFVVLFGFHLDFTLFPFPVITAQFIASSRVIREAV
jgi:hypothetical protein